jgi:hypothetical protein
VSRPANATYTAPPRARLRGDRVHATAPTRWGGFPGGLGCSDPEVLSEHTYGLRRDGNVQTSNDRLLRWCIASASGGEEVSLILKGGGMSQLPDLDAEAHLESGIVHQLTK